MKSYKQDSDFTEISVREALLVMCSYFLALIVLLSGVPKNRMPEKWNASVFFLFSFF